MAGVGVRPRSAAAAVLVLLGLATTGPDAWSRPAAAAAVPAATDGASPSGARMPQGDLPGWRQSFADDFTGKALNTRNWFPYGGHPGGGTQGWWDPSHVVVKDDLLVLRGYRDPSQGNRIVTAGVQQRRDRQQAYGRYLVRYRMAPGTGVSHAVLLWPGDGSWPPEVDVSEENGRDRQTSYQTLHSADAAGKHVQDQLQTTVDLTQWHTLGVDWVPGSLTYTLDGAVTHVQASAAVPAEAMALALQTQAFQCRANPWQACADSSTPKEVDMQVDWAVAYSPLPCRPGGGPLELRTSPSAQQVARQATAHVGARLLQSGRECQAGLPVTVMARGRGAQQFHVSRQLVTAARGLVLQDYPLQAADFRWYATASTAWGDRAVSRQNLVQVR